MGGKKRERERERERERRRTMPTVCVRKRERYLLVVRLEQCDQMARIFVQYLAI